MAAGKQQDSRPLPHPGIQPEILYNGKQLREVTGLGEDAVRAAKVAGLRVIHRHGRDWILGADFIAYITITNAKK